MYHMINSSDIEVRTFDTLRDVSLYLFENKLGNIIYEGEKFELTDEDNERVAIFWHNKRNNYSVATGDGYLYDLTEDRYGSGWIVSMDNGNCLALPLSNESHPIPFEAVLAILGLYRGFNYYKGERE